MQLIEINPLEVKKAFPSFYHQKVRFFLIEHEGQEIGIYGVKTHDQETCEIRLHVFKESRGQLYYRNGLRLLLSFPFSLGFVKILISSRVKSVITLLGCCEKLGVQFIGAFKDKIWFCLERKNYERRQ